VAIQVTPYVQSFGANPMLTEPATVDVVVYRSNEPRVFVEHQSSLELIPEARARASHADKEGDQIAFYFNGVMAAEDVYNQQGSLALARPGGQVLAQAQIDALGPDGPLRYFSWVTDSIAGKAPELWVPLADLHDEGDLEVGLVRAGQYHRVTCFHYSLIIPRSMRYGSCTTSSP
jgi:hypothetical protein